MTRKNESIKFFNNTDFHDSSLESITFDIAKKALSICVGFYDDNRNFYYAKKFCFVGISNLRFDQDSFNLLNIVDRISGFDILSGDRDMANLILILGDGGVIEIKWNFEFLELDTESVL